MAFSVLEFADVTSSNEPMWPPHKRSIGQALSTAFLLDPTTKYVVVCPDADMRLAISTSSTVTAAGTDAKVLAGDNAGFHIRRGPTTYLYGI